MRICLLLLLLGLYVHGSGQKHSISFHYKPSLSYFGNKGENENSIYYLNPDSNTSFKNAVSLLYIYGFSRKISFSTGIEYAQQGQQTSFRRKDNRYSHHFTTTLNYLRIPFLIQYKLLQNNSSDLSINTGVSMGVAVKRHDNLEHWTWALVISPAEDRYKKLDWAIPIGGMYTKQLSRGIFANLGFEYLFGLTNALYKGTGTIPPLFKNYKNTRIGLNAGIGFHIK